MRCRPGAVSLAELLLVAWLFALVLAGVARYAAGQGRLAAYQQDRLRLEEAVRTTAVVLGAELRFLAPGDMAAAGPDSLRIRAFRGGGRVCQARDGRLLVSFAGLRAPDPARDSVLVLARGAATAHRLDAVRSAAGCEAGLELDLGPPDPVGGAYVLVFETGGYYLNDGAFRYRRGAGGRQPLTEAVFRDAAFERAADGAVLRLAPDPDSLPRLPTAARSVRVWSLNYGAAP